LHIWLSWCVRAELSCRGVYIYVCKTICFLAGFRGQINQELALYTDTDVMFYHEFNPCKLQKPDILAIAPETERVGSTWSDINKNSGVLFINVKGLAVVLPQMIGYANAENWSLPAYDQGLINKFFPHSDPEKRQLDPLPHAYNWKGYWGYNPDIVIAHWHGPKPERCLKCFIEHIEQGKTEKGATFSCQCQAGYDTLWERAMEVDKGKMYLKMLRDYEVYLEMKW